MEGIAPHHQHPVVLPGGVGVQLLIHPGQDLLLRVLPVLIALVQPGGQIGCPLGILAQQQLQRQGATLDAYLAAQQITADQFKEDVKAQAADTVKQNLALDAYARHNNIVVTDEEVVDEFKNSGAKDTDKLYAEWKKQGRLSFVREGILRGKALEALLKEAEIEEVELPTADEEEKKPAKKAAAKKTTKKAAKKADEAEAENTEAAAE